MMSGRGLGRVGGVMVSGRSLGGVGGVYGEWEEFRVSGFRVSGRG